MAERDQVKPLAPQSHRNRSDEDKALSEHLKFHHSRRKYIKICGVFAAIILIFFVVIISLTFTIFQIRDPKIKMNSVTIQRFEFANGTLRKDVNVSLLADVSVKNPNIAAFRFSNTTTEIYYGGVLVGKGMFPQGVAEARRTLRRNVTVEIVPAKISAVPTMNLDLAAGEFNISSFTRIAGKVKILGFVKRNVVVRLNCTMSYNVSGGGFQGQHCRNRVTM